MQLPADYCVAAAMVVLKVWTNELPQAGISFETLARISHKVDIKPKFITSLSCVRIYVDFLSPSGKFL